MKLFLLSKKDEPCKNKVVAGGGWYGQRDGCALVFIHSRLGTFCRAQLVISFIYLFILSPG